MRRTRILRAVLPLALLAGAVAAPHAQAETQRFTYVATTVGIGTDADDPLSDTGIHPLGYFGFDSRGRSFLLTLEDIGTLAAARIPVAVVVSRTIFRACVPARTPTRLPAGRKGAKVYVFVDTAVDAGLRCGGSGTTGTAVVKQ